MNTKEFDLGYVVRDYQLSICIPTFNRGKFIEETLKSIIPQLSHNVEIIIFDGASSDNTIDVVLNTCKDMSQVRYFRQEKNGGIDLDMASSVEMSSAPYCWLFSSDDIMMDGAIKEIIGLIEVSKSDIILCGMTLCASDMSPICDHHIWSVGDNRTYDLSIKDIRKQYLQNSLTTTALFSFLGNIIFKRQVWDQGSNSEVYLGSCWAHVARFMSLIPQGLKVSIFQKPLLLNRGGNDSFSKDGKIARIALSIDGFLKIFNSYFGENSLETQEIIRILNYEWPFHAYIDAYDNIPCSKQGDKKELMRLFKITHPSNNARDMLLQFILENRFSRKLYRIMVILKNYSKRLIKLWTKKEWT
ncbi:glycosyltransferase [Amylibacter sp.]|nr:glycosyltransferase [Amylibacter sp.]